ncbi:MAG: hypothetical protein AB7F32_01085 [Victivallaceae bacterium]
MQRILLLCCAAFCCGVVPATELIPGVKVGDRGVLEVEAVKIAVMHFSADWRNADQRRQSRVEPDFPSTAKGNYRTRLRLPLAGGSAEATLSETLTVTGPDTLEAEYRFNVPAPVKTGRLGLNLTLPCDVFAGRTLTVDGEKIPLGKSYVPNRNRFWRSAKTLSIPRPGGALTLSGEFALLIQDDRQFGGNDFSISLYFAPGTGEISDAALNFQLRNADIASTPVEIKNTRPFAEVEALKSFTPGKAGGVNFAGTGVLCLGPAAKTSIPASGKKPFLYLLHAFGGEGATETPAATVTVRYRNGGESKFPLFNGVHAAAAGSLRTLEGDQGALVWIGDKQATPGGLYLTRLELKPELELAAIELAAAPGRNWLVAGLASSNDAIDLPAKQPVLAVPNAEWRPIGDDRGTVKGSILDFSDLVDAPAGKYGHLITRGGHFAFAGAPDKPVRFYGANLCFSANFMEKEFSDQVASRMAMTGYNTARIHHYDADLSKRTGKELAADQLDRLNYLFAALKKQGLYISIDLFTIRKIDPQVIPEVAGKLSAISMTDYKMLLPVSGGAFADWQKFARAVLTTRNPYTGMTWGEDPALITICTVNEDGPMHYAENPVIRDLYQARFQAWQAEHPELVTQPHEAQFRRFLAELWSTCFARQREFLHSLGCRALLTDLNWYATPYLAAIRDGFDLVDNHQYHDHPSFPVQEWRMPFGFRNTNPVLELASTPRELMPTRIFGKPFTVTEFNYCFPNPYRNGGTLLFGAYAALQDWDAVYRFAWSHEADAVKRTKEIGPFDIVNDPAAQLAERLGILLFRRGDAAPGKERTAYILGNTTEEWTRQVYPAAFTRLGLRQQIGTVLAGKVLPAGVKPFTGNDQSEAKVITSDTGEITLDAENGDFRAVTPRTEGFMLASGRPGVGKIVKVTPDRNFQVAAAAVRDNAASLATSKRILIVHLSQSVNFRARFDSSERKLLEALGTAPLLFRVAKADFELDLPALKNPKLYRLDHTGKRVGELIFKRENGKISFRNEAAETPALELTGD